ncbi:hypothetical protein DFH07DRAFT_784989 [Mycena maculata]|uniref:Uncharacterized protein n=1 Tax=Mycena maculata TaxID=230809 RepID=A0AAD7HDE8_9AGAR|nr:hypothetical protein DFH07DRAFT_784989 [Mycena maculata]
MGSPFATQEDPESLWYEQSNYVSTHLAAMGYGVHIVVFATVTYYTLLMRGRTASRMRIFWLIFNTLIFSMGTINLACSIAYNENAWVNDREYPGGPFNYLIGEQSISFMTLGNVASILASFMSDGLLLYRAGVLWNFAWYIVVPPALFFIACIILSVMTVIQLALPTAPLPPLSLAVWIVLMILPIWLTVLIAGRILYHRRTMVDVLGPEYAKNYAGIAAIVVESALPFTIISAILLGLFGDQNIAQNLFVPLMVQVECIAPELIILRVVLGRSWTKGTMSGDGIKHSALQFASPHKRDPKSEFDEATLDAALRTRSTRSETTDAHHQNRTSMVILNHGQHGDEEKKDDNPSGSSVNVVCNRV